MRRTWVVAAASLAAVVACKKPGGGEPAASSGSSSGSAAATDAGSAVAAPVPVKPAPVDATALDKVLAERKVAAGMVVKRASGPASQWALISHRDQDKKIRAYELLLVTAHDSASVLVGPPKGNDAQFEDLASAVSLEVRDLDGDGHDDALLVVDWERSARVSDPCQGCFRTQDEEGRDLSVVSGDSGAPMLAFEHLVKYTSRSEGNPESNTTPYADPDEIVYDWKVSGTPPVLKLTRTKGTIGTKNRLPGTLDLTTEPSLSAGAGKDVPLVLK